MEGRIKRTFTFDREPEVGKYKLEIEYHACVASEDFRPRKGSECEKRVVKHFDKPNSLPAR